MKRNVNTYFHNQIFDLFDWKLNCVGLNRSISESFERLWVIIDFACATSCVPKLSRTNNSHCIAFV